MKRLLMLCAVLSLTGCAGKPVPAPPSPVNGMCGITQDTCRTGTPSATGDSSSPYEWTCGGQFGGTPDYCSVPTARIERREVVAGKNALEEKVKAAGPLRGLVTIYDITLDHPDCEPPFCHAHVMKQYVLDMGIPEENIHLIPDLPTDPAILEKTLVYSYPTSLLLGMFGAFPWEPESLHVAAAGNTEPDGRDAWYRDNPNWSGDGGAVKWTNAMNAFATGRVIMAKYAVQDTDGTILPYEGNVKCGQAKEFCYSMFAPENQDRGTSGASVNLGALAFYLFQLWDTPREVVGVLNTCAEDVGEPGIDEEFGRGIVSVVCDTVHNRERGVVASSMQTFAASPVLNQMLGGDVAYAPQSLAPRLLPAKGRFRTFYAVRGYTFETATGYLGGQFSLRGTDLFVSGGADYSPLGVRSSLLHAARTPFTEVGVRRNLFSGGGHRISLLGSYGYSERNSMSAHVKYLGGRYGYRFSPASVLSLYAGHRSVHGSLGIPGYRRAGADAVPFTDNTPEVRLLFTLSR